MTPEEILNLPMQENDADAATIREYLVKLILVAWDEKRPFGNSGWHYELYLTLIKADLIEGSTDEDGYVDYVDFVKGEQLIFEAIEAMK